MPSAFLYLGDCLQEMRHIPDASVDVVICDPPFGVLNSKSDGGKWDSIIPLEPFWEEILRVAKHNAALVFFAQGMFTAELMLSQRKLWRYNLVYQKTNPTGFLNANRMPMRSHEDICVFYRQLPTYNPQMVFCGAHKRNHTRGNLENAPVHGCYGEHKETPTIISDEKFPISVLKFQKPHYKGQHPTEKPVDLCRWLVRTYSNKGETVLDPTMGSGTTGVAAMLEGRNFVGIEKDEKHFERAAERIEKAQTTPQQAMLEF